MSENSYRLGTPDNEIPEEDKIHFLSMKEMAERYKDIFDYFLACAVPEDFPKDIAIKWRWEDGRLHMKYVDHSEHRPY